MELLLFLVRREGVDIREVRIAPICDAFLAHLRLLQEHGDAVASSAEGADSEVLDAEARAGRRAAGIRNMEIAGEYIVMAATLCHLKSLELLPRALVPDAEAVEDDPREELARRLLEYQRYKEASENLAERPMFGRDVFGAPPPATAENANRPVEAGTDAMGLLETFYRILSQHSAAPAVHEVHLEPYSLRERAQWLLDRLADGPRELHDLLSLVNSSRDRVLTFLASLEMGRLQLIDLNQARHLGAIVLRAKVEVASADLAVLSEGA